MTAALNAIEKAIQALKAAVEALPPRLAAELDELAARRLQRVDRPPPVDDSAGHPSDR